MDDDQRTDAARRLPVPLPVGEPIHRRHSHSRRHRRPVGVLAVPIAIVLVVAAVVTALVVRVNAGGPITMPPATAPTSLPTTPSPATASPAKLVVAPSKRAIPSRSPHATSTPTTTPAPNRTAAPTRTATPRPDPTDVAAGRPVTDTGNQSGYPASNAVDSDPGSYWESTNNAFPQSITIDLGTAVTVARVVVRLPALAAWTTRTQTVSVAGSRDGSSYASLATAAGYTFDPSTGNTATIPCAPVDARFVRLTFTANTGWPAGQAAEIAVYPL